MDETNTYYIAAILNPRFKGKQLENDLSPEDYLTIAGDIRSFFQIKYDYISSHSAGEVDSSELLNHRSYSIESRMLRALHQDSQSLSDSDRYFDTEVVNIFAGNDPDWLFKWQHVNTSEYPCMSAAARDYLSVLASEVSAERLFSGGGEIFQDLGDIV